MPNDESMYKEGFVYEEGEVINAGTHGDHDYVYAEGDPVPDTGKSGFVFESGTGIGGKVIIDSFDDGNIDEYGGRKGGFAVQSDPSIAIDGEQYLTGVARYGSNNSIYSVPTSSRPALNTYPSRGDTFRVSLRFEDHYQGAMSFEWGYQGSSRGADTYGVELNLENNEFILGVGPGYNPTSNIIAEETRGYFSYDDEWLVLEVEWGDPTITATLYQTDDGGNPIYFPLASVSGDDTKYDDGGIGFLVDAVDVTSKINGLFDYARII